MTLTIKQRDFIEEYLYDFNATNAAKRAGYNPVSAHVSGHRNLKNPEIVRILQIELHEQRWRPTRIRDYAIDGLTKVADDENSPLHLKVKAYIELHKIALAMEKIMAERDFKNQDYYERTERQDIQQQEHRYRQEHAMEEYEKELEEEEKELAMIAKQEEEAEKHYQEARAEIPDDADILPQSSKPESPGTTDKPILQPSSFSLSQSPEKKSTHNWPERKKETTDPKGREAENEKWEHLEENVWKLIEPEKRSEG